MTEEAPNAAAIVAELTRGPVSAPSPQRAGLVRGERERLPSRRDHTTHGLCVGGHKMKVQIGTRADGTVCELFIRMHKEGAPVRALVSAIARIVSSALQHGVPLAELASDLRAFEDGSDLTVEGHDKIKRASSMHDAIGQILETYPGGRKQVPPCG